MAKNFRKTGSILLDHPVRREIIVTSIVTGMTGKTSGSRKMAMPTEVKHPVILPKHSQVSKLILTHIHQQYMLSKLHQRYWLSGANSSARKSIKNCVFCR